MWLRGLALSVMEAEKVRLVSLSYLPLAQWFLNLWQPLSSSINIALLFKLNQVIFSLKLSFKLPLLRLGSFQWQVCVFNDLFSYILEILVFLSPQLSCCQSCEFPVTGCFSTRGKGGLDSLLTFEGSAEDLNRLDQHQVEQRRKLCWSSFSSCFLYLTFFASRHQLWTLFFLIL